MPNFFQRVANAMRNFANRVIGAGPQPTPVSPTPPPPPPEAYEEYPTPGMQEEPPAAPAPTPEPIGDCNGIEYIGRHKTGGYEVLGRWCLLGGCPASFLYELVSRAYYENGEPDFLTFIVTGIPCEDSPTRAVVHAAAQQKKGLPVTPRIEPGEEATFGFVWGWEQVTSFAMKSASLLDFVNNQMAIDPEHSDECFLTVTEICILDKRRQ